ncbi:MAG: hypothetical protein MR598_06980 [Erysipelotrichaceae bacterium]|nr:hypothetical protein [Erysipelotrichaceae bacterium]
MSFKKLLGIISIVIVVMFALMLTTSYAWYSFEAASTTFNAVTSNDDVIVSFQRGEYIDTNIAVPIASDDVDQYSEKNNFTIRVKDNQPDNEMLVTISLVDITIASALQNTNFKIDLYHQNKNVASYAGNTIGTSGATTKKLADVVLDNDIDNNFELRVYILDNGSDQSSMMNKTFQATIKIDVISRLKATMTSYENPDIYVSSITIDGQSSTHLPTSGYYTMSSTCTKGSSLSWEPLSKTITYASGAKVNDSCSLTFTSGTNYPKLNTVDVGSYVKYVGNNGCDGKHCEGENANYVSDDDMGYCSSSNYKFTVNGWRVGYIQDNTAYLISAGAPECVRTYMDSKSTGVGAQTFSTNYYYGSGYQFDKTTGKFSLTGVTSSTLAWSSNYTSIISNTPYTCKSTSATETCTMLYEITEYYSSTQGKAYLHYNYDSTNGAPTHLAKLDSRALKYCNTDYAYGGICNSSSAWAMDATDFQIITGSVLSSSSCYNQSSKVACGYRNDLIDNGGYYWYATSYSASSYHTFSWIPNYRYVDAYISINLRGVRPVLRLESSVLVVGGSGTYEDPYIISNE